MESKEALANLDRGNDKTEEGHVDWFAGLDDLCERHSAGAHGQHRATVCGSRKETCGPGSVFREKKKPTTPITWSQRLPERLSVKEPLIGNTANLKAWQRAFICNIQH